MKFTVCAKDVGNFLAVLGVVEALDEGEHEFLFLLQRGSPAYHYLAASDDIQRRTCDYLLYNVSWDDGMLIQEEVVSADAVIVGLSASGRSNIEIDVAHSALRHNKKLFAIEEVPGGRNNPGWRDYHNVLRAAHILSAINQAPWPNETVVGPMSLNKYEGLNWDELVQSARSKLGITDAKVVWCLLHPNRESVPALADVCRATIGAFDEEQPGVLVVTRHHREREHPVPFNREAYASILSLTARELRIVDNSPGLPDLPTWNADEPSWEKPCELLTYNEMIALCKAQGIIVTGFCTVGLVDAPYLRVPSALYLPDGLGWGSLYLREKGLITIPFPEYRNVGDLNELTAAMWRSFNVEDREASLAKLTEQCPWPQDVANKTVRAILLACET